MPSGKGSRRFRCRLVLVPLLVLGVLTNCAAASSGGVAVKVPAQLTLSVEKRFGHDTSCFTEGLQWTSTVAGGGFYESCGEVGASTIRITNLQGKVLRKESVPNRAFAEGTVRLGNRLYQLTWQERLVFVRDPKTLRILKTLPLPGEIAEGWGLSSRGAELVVSDGSSSIHFLDPKTWKVTRTIPVTAAGTPVTRLNELEFVNGQLWANVWQTEQIVVINPDNGQVTATVSLAGLRPTTTRNNQESVANGIAFDPKTGRIFVTGKNWPVLYQVTTKPG